MQYEPIQIASTSSMQLRATHTKHVIIWTYKREVRGNLKIETGGSRKHVCKSNFLDAFTSISRTYPGKVRQSVTNTFRFPLCRCL